jgi:hypothetical protein
MRLIHCTQKPKHLDLAGSCSDNLSYLQTRSRINHLIDRYLSTSILNGRLDDLKVQFIRPKARPWDPICWKDIHINQIVGVNSDVFLKILAGAVEIEDPIRLYAQESYGYLVSSHSKMAKFMGGSSDEKGSLVEISVWEKEERQYGPVFRKIYQQLTGRKLVIKPNSVAGYHPSQNPRQDAYTHTLSRVSTEWGALSVYLWLAAHSTGELQKVVVQPLQDEVNHLAKFWGFNYWAFTQRYTQSLKKAMQSLWILIGHHQQERSQSQSLLKETPQHQQLRILIELAFTLSRVMVRPHLASSA